MALGEKERLLMEVEKEREVWRQRDRALATVLQEKDALIQELESCRKDTQVINNNVISVGGSVLASLLFKAFNIFHSKNKLQSLHCLCNIE